MNDLRHVLKKYVPWPIYRQVSYAAKIRAWIKKEGYANWRATRPYDGADVTLQLRSLEHPFSFLRLYSHVLGLTDNVIRREYDRFLPDNPQVIVDAGGFIGDLACHWATRFPNARIVVIEPNSVNYAFAERNLKPYGSRVTLIKKGLWSRAARLKVVGEQMHSHVVETNGDEFDVDATDVPWLLSQVGGRIDVLKLDIEGAEAEVLGESAAAWIDRIGMIVAEVHGPEIESAILPRMKSLGFEPRYYRNLVSFVRPSTPA
jgi:FkbM family methyltransferase